ncbi:olfactory receptor 1020-like [Bombina bombina]|uniref:olfactory receptor 1020-like n=1 Tax=Bombina bombina TaxID=8345 RepID=UPI00235A8BEF|nr:olfactory receptor 1020-like [Bombina bombina]
MEYSNSTFASSFILLGLSDSTHFQAIYFLLFLVMYIITLFGNMLLIVLVRISNQLQTPMYFFLSTLSFIDICFSSTIVPKILVNTLSKDRSISLSECASQMYFSLVLGATECIILVSMAYDRYAAICRPLLYNIIMNKRFCLGLNAASWAVGLSNAAIQVLFTFQLPYCRSHHVNHFFCEVPPFLKLACRDTWLNELLLYISAGIIAGLAFFLTLISYIYIISTILKIKSSQSRYKAFSTCSSHLTVVSLYFSTILFMYLHPHSRYSTEIDKTVPVLYTTVTPMLNPIIYSMRNNDVKRIIKTKVIRKIYF